MKICPMCRRQYDDDMSFCLEDGTPLAGDEASDKITEMPTEEYGAETLALPGDAPQTTIAAIGNNITTQPQYISPQGDSGSGSSNKVGFLVVAAFLLVGVVVLLGAGVVGLWLYSSTKNDLAIANNTNEGRNASNNAVNNDQSGTNTTDVFGSDDDSNANIRPTPSPGASTVKPTPGPTKDTKIEPEPTKEPLDVSPFPTPARTPGVPKTISGGVLNTKAISLPRPPYPPIARAAGASGSVSVQVLIDEKGNVVSASAVSGHPLLRAAAVNAARGAKFSPTMLSGQPVKVSGVITYNFVP